MLITYNKICKLNITIKVVIYKIHIIYINIIIINEELNIIQNLNGDISIE